VLPPEGDAGGEVLEVNEFSLDGSAGWAYSLGTRPSRWFFREVSFTFIRSPAVNKSELTQKLADRTNLSKSDAQNAVDALFSADDGIIAEALKSGDKVQITGFGSFETRQREARTGRNPRTGKEIEIGPSTSAAFRAGKGLKDAVSGT
jgi:DNA-binding protein HU-beta